MERQFLIKECFIERLYCYALKNTKQKQKKHHFHLFLLVYLCLQHHHLWYRSQVAVCAAGKEPETR